MTTGKQLRGIVFSFAQPLNMLLAFVTSGNLISSPIFSRDAQEPNMLGRIFEGRKGKSSGDLSDWCIRKSIRYAGERSEC